MAASFVALKSPCNCVEYLNWYMLLCEIRDEGSWSDSGTCPALCWTGQMLSLEMPCSWLKRMVLFVSKCPENNWFVNSICKQLDREKESVVDHSTLIICSSLKSPEIFLLA